MDDLLRNNDKGDTIINNDKPSGNGGNDSNTVNQNTDTSGTSTGGNKKSQSQIDSESRFPSTFDIISGLLDIKDTQDSEAFVDAAGVVHFKDKYPTQTQLGYYSSVLSTITPQQATTILDKMKRVPKAQTTSANEYHKTLPKNISTSRNIIDESNARVQITANHLKIGDVVFQIPPEYISIVNNSQTIMNVALRQGSTIKTKTGHSNKSIMATFFLNGIDNINGIKTDSPFDYPYYMDGLLGLIAQFKCTPFLPIENQYVNSNGIYAVALKSMSVSTVKGFPNCVEVVVMLDEFEATPYIEAPSFFFDKFIEWDLQRYYYQRHIHRKLKKLNGSLSDSMHLKILSLDKFMKNTSSEDDFDMFNEDNYIDVLSNKNNSDFSVTSVEIGISNIFSTQQLQAYNSPTMQYLGGNDVSINITIETKSSAIVASVTEMIDNTQAITRLSRDSIGTGFVKVDNNFINMLGVNNFMINNVTSETVPEFPDLYVINFECVSFDLDTKEMLKGFRPFKGSDIGTEDNLIAKKRKGLEEKIKQDNMIERKLTTLNVYPDLDLPTYHAADLAITQINTYKNARMEQPLSYTKMPRTGSLSPGSGPNGAYQGYVEPDFYFKYDNNYSDIDSSTYEPVENSASTYNEKFLHRKQEEEEIEARKKAARLEAIQKAKDEASKSTSTNTENSTSNDETGNNTKSSYKNSDTKANNIQSLPNTMKGIISNVWSELDFKVNKTGRNSSNVKFYDKNIFEEIKPRTNIVEDISPRIKLQYAQSSLPVSTTGRMFDIGQNDSEFELAWKRGNEKWTYSTGAGGTGGSGGSANLEGVGKLTVITNNAVADLALSVLGRSWYVWGAFGGEELTTEYLNKMARAWPGYNNRAEQKAACDKGWLAFDCSSLASWCLRKCGVKDESFRCTSANFASDFDQSVPLSQVQAGDILRRSGHVGVAIGNGETVEANGQSKGVNKCSLGTNWSNVGRYNGVPTTEELLRQMGQSTNGTDTSDGTSSSNNNANDNGTNNTINGGENNPSGGTRDISGGRSMEIFSTREITNPNARPADNDIDGSGSSGSSGSGGSASDGSGDNVNNGTTTEENSVFNGNITSSMIDKIMKEKLAGKGSVFIASGQQHNVNPALAAAISAHETGYGTSNLIKSKNNCGGIRASRNSFKSFASVDEGIDELVSLLYRGYISQGLTSLADIGNKYCPTSDPYDYNNLNAGWPGAVARVYKEITGVDYDPSMASAGGVIDGATANGGGGGGLELVYTGAPSTPNRLPNLCYGLKYSDKTSDLNIASIGRPKLRYSPYNFVKDEEIKSKEEIEKENEIIKQANDKFYGTNSNSNESNFDNNINSSITGNEVNAEFSAYYPANTTMQGGMYDAMGNRLNPANNTCAAPKEIPFGTKIVIKGTGTNKDGVAYTVTDRGGAIKVRNDGTYVFDLLMATKNECYSWGRKKGKAIIATSGGNNGSTRMLEDFKNTSILLDDNLIKPKNPDDLEWSLNYAEQSGNYDGPITPDNPLSAKPENSNDDYVWSFDDELIDEDLIETQTSYEDFWSACLNPGTEPETRWEQDYEKWALANGVNLDSQGDGLIGDEQEEDGEGEENEDGTVTEYYRLFGVTLGKKDFTEEEMAKRQARVNSYNAAKATCVDIVNYSHSGRMVRAFPSYLFLIADDGGGWIDGRKLWTNYYNFNPVMSIKIHQAKHSPIHTAYISLSNMSGKLNKKTKEFSLLQNIADSSEYNKFIRTIYKHTGLLLCSPKITQESIDIRNEILEAINLRAGARIHTRIGYGSNPLQMPICFNGQIAEVDAGEIISIVAQSDGVELLNNMIALKNDDDTNNLFRYGSEASNIIGGILIERENKWSNFINERWGEASKYGIEHFGIHLGYDRDDVNKKEYDLLKNIYTATYNPVRYVNSRSFADEEKNVNMFLSNKYPWEIFKGIEQTMAEFVCYPMYHQFESRLFFGLPWFETSFRYDCDTAGTITEQFKAFGQFHFVNSLNSIIKNDIKSGSKELFTNAICSYSQGGKTKKTPTIYSDRNIDVSVQKTKIIDTSVSQDYVGPDGLYKFLGFNIGETAAINTALCNLLDSWNKTYKGELIVIGDASIKPYDYLYLDDYQSDMCGLCNVREVVHSFTMETGFVTSITPGLISSTMLHNSGAGNVHKSLINLGNSLAINCRSKYISNIAAMQFKSAICASKTVRNLGEGINKISELEKVAGLSNKIYELYKSGALIGDEQSLKNTTDYINETIKGLDGVKTGSKVKEIADTLKAGSLVVFGLAGPLAISATWLASTLLFDILLNSIIDEFAYNHSVYLLPMMHKGNPFVSGNRGCSDSLIPGLGEVEDTRKDEIVEEGDETSGSGKSIDLNDNSEAILNGLFGNNEEEDEEEENND